MRRCVAAIIIMLCAAPAFAAMQARPVEWSVGKDRFSGVLVYEAGVEWLELGARKHDEIPGFDPHSRPTPCAFPNSTISSTTWRCWFTLIGYTVV